MFGLKKKTKIKTMGDCVDLEKGRDFLVIGAGGTLREFEGEVKKLIEDNGLLTVGINKMTSLCVPDYHLWTNRQRWRDLGDCISEKSTMIFGNSLHERPKLIRKHYKGDYIFVDYESKDGEEIDFRDGVIHGNFRTAGVLAIMICHLFGARDIYIAGMDGFTLHRKDDVEAGNKHHHIYGKGYTDDATWDECVEKDRLVYENLKGINDWGVDFKIITPTKFEQFYNPKGLENG